VPFQEKRISKLEREFARLIAEEDQTPVNAARRVFGWKCEPNTKETMKAKDLARSRRVTEFISLIQKQDQHRAAAESILGRASRIDWDNLRTFAYDRLKEIRDDEHTNSRSRWEAIKGLERLADPSKDINLIWLWIEEMWRGYTIHCPCCHKNNPLSSIRNDRLDEWRKKQGQPTDLPPLDSELERRLSVIKRAEKRKDPHPQQIAALAAPERHIAGKGAARAGKSLLLAMFALLYFLLPGVEVWLLARVYDDARSEMEYLEHFLKTMFGTLYPHMVKVQEDKQSGEIVILSRWGSEIRIKSGKSKGSITGRELEAILVAEPAWVDASLFEEVRARMSSRLGRVLAVGTPKGYGGFLHRMIKLGGRTLEGKKVKEEERLISAGAPWGKSMYVFHMTPSANPEYVQSEQEAAKEELTAAEYAGEFQGEMRAAEGARFPFITDNLCRPINPSELTEASFVLGVDQGERNFAGVLLGWDGNRIYALTEYFDDTNNTIKANAIELNQRVPSYIRLAGGRAEDWQLTIFDADPPINNILDEMAEEYRPWKSDITYRTKNRKDFTNWREETYMYINQMAKQGLLVFDEERADQLHDQLMEALRKSPPEGKDSKATLDKGWVVRDPWRGDHVLDAFVMAIWCLYMKMITPPIENQDPGDPYEEARRGQDFMRQGAETKELQGFNGPYDPRKERAPHIDSGKLFREKFGRTRTNYGTLASNPGYYKDES
jgi:hypothetical protein